MKKLILLIIFLTLIVGFSSVVGVKAEDNLAPTVYGAAFVLVKPNTTFSVPVYIKNVNDAYALGFDINYDSDLIQLTSIAKGSFMGSSNTIFSYGSNIPGKVLVGISKYGKNIIGVKGNGLLFTLKFKALALGSTKIDFSYCELYDSTINNNKINCNFNPIEVTVTTSSKVRNSGDLVTLILTIGKSTMSIDGKTGYKVGASPVISKGVTYIPIRAVVEELGGIVEWVASTKNIIVRMNGKEISMFVNKSIAYIDGMPVVMDPNSASVYPKILYGAAMVPLRFTAENLGMNVVWEAKLKTITLTYTIP